MTRQHHKGPDPAIRPFGKPSKSLIVDLFLRGIPEIVGTHYSRSTSDMLRRIRDRQQAAEDIYTTVLEATVGVRQFGGELASEFPKRNVATNYAGLLQIVAANWPAYAEGAHLRDVGSRSHEIIKYRGKQELIDRQSDWDAAMEEFADLKKFPDKLSKKRRKELESDFLQPHCTRRMLVDVYPGKTRKREPLEGRPSLVMHRSKTIDSLARKTFIRIVQQMSDEEATRIEKIMRKGGSVDKIAQHLFHYAYELDIYDAMGITLVYPTLADRDRGISAWWKGVAQYNLECEAEKRPRDRIIIATDSEGRIKERDYADPRKAKKRPYEAEHKTWLVGKNEDPLEVRSDTIWGFATGLAKNTRLSHRLYDSRKEWERKTTDGKPWTNSHRYVYDMLYTFSRKRFEPLGVQFPEG
ncbi:hypothetical protein GOV07_04720 [Candidatus Woesearchaeota archaeon]|nr:hypothetical protein [Candidatus Woesearchaeota archaeon]